MKFAFVLAVCIILTSGLAVNANIIVSLSDGTSVELEGYQIFYRGSTVQPLLEPLTASITTDPQSAYGKFVISDGYTTLEQEIIEAQEQGCLGFISASNNKVIGGYLGYRVNDPETASQINITVVELGFVKLQAGLGSELLLKLMANKSVESITVLPDYVPNPWITVLSSPWIYVWTVSMMVYSAVNISFAIWKLVKFTEYYGGCTQSIAIYVLSIEIVANIIRMISAVDFFGSNFIFPETMSITLGELWIPFTIASFLLFTLYWHELMTNASVIVHPGITKMKIPFFVISGFILAVQIVKNIVRNQGLFRQANWLTSIFYLLTCSFIIVFYSVTGIKLLKRLNKSKHLGKTVNLTKSTIKVLVSGGFLLFFLVIALLFTTGIPYTPIGYVVTWYVAYAVVNTASLMNILAFELPSKRSSNSSRRASVPTTQPTATNETNPSEPVSQVAAP